MTITSTTNRVSYAGDGGTTEFSFPHRFLTDADLTVILVVDSTGVETTQTLTTDYTVSGAGAASGGTVTMNSAPATGETLVIINDPDLKQGYDPEDGSALGADSLETAVDKLTILAQRTRVLVERSFRLSDGDTSGASLELPAPTALNLVRWDSNGTALENVTLTDLGDSVASVADNEVLVKLPGADADGLAMAANTLLARAGGNIEDLSLGEQQFLGRLSGGDIKALTAEETRRVLDDPEHATDSATDAYVSATNTTPPADGVKITRDFQSANTTTTPTLDGKTMTTRDGSALWAGAVSGPHELQYASGTDTYLVLEPNPSSQEDPIAYADTQDATFAQQRAQAWVNFAGTGTVAIRDHYNVSSITDNGTGNYTVNFSTNLSNNDYATLLSCRLGSSSENLSASFGTQSSGGVDVHVESLDGTRTDASTVGAVFFGGE